MGLRRVADLSDGPDRQRIAIFLGRYWSRAGVRHFRALASLQLARCYVPCSDEPAKRCGAMEQLVASGLCSPCDRSDSLLLPAHTG